MESFGVEFDVKKHVSDCVRRNLKSDADGASNRAAEDTLIAGSEQDLLDGVQICYGKLCSRMLLYWYSLSAGKV